MSHTYLTLIYWMSTPTFINVLKSLSSFWLVSIWEVPSVPLLHLLRGHFQGYIFGCMLISFCWISRGGTTVLKITYIHHVWAVFSKDSKRCIRPVSLYETACFSVLFWLQLAFLLIFVMLAIYVLLRWVSSSPPPLWDCYWFANSSLYIKTV